MIAPRGSAAPFAVSNSRATRAAAFIARGGVKHSEWLARHRATGRAAGRSAMNALGYRQPCASGEKLSSPVMDGGASTARQQPLFRPTTLSTGPATLNAVSASRMVSRSAFTATERFMAGTSPIGASRLAPPVTAGRLAAAFTALAVLARSVSPMLSDVGKCFSRCLQCRVAPGKVLPAPH